MCKSPIKVRSPKLAAGTFIQGVDKEFLCVPCGHCEECQEKKRNDLLFRMYYEYLSTETCKKLYGYGFSLFQTLTYNEVNVPVYDGFRFFRKSDLQLFMKRLRKRLSDDGYDVKDGSLKYVITCELGSKHFRPHYHVNFFVKFNIKPEVFDAYVRLCWSTLGTKYSKMGEIGFVDRSYVGQRIINSIAALRYVSKYITKGTSIATAVKKQAYTTFSKFVNQYCFESKGRILWKNLNDNDLVEIWRAWLHYHPEFDSVQLLPFYLQSKFLGLEFLEQSAYEDLFDVINLPSNSPTGFSPVSLPMYYVRKVFYSYDKESKRFILNKNGIDYKNHLNFKMSESYLDLMKENKALYNAIFLNLYKDSRFSSLSDCIDYYLKNSSYQNFIDYVVYLKDRCISPLHYWLIPTNTHDLLSNLHEFCSLVNEDSLNQYLIDSPSFIWKRFDSDLYDGLGDGESVNPMRISVGLLPLYNSLPCFRGFDDLYLILSRIKKEFSKARCLILSDEEKTSNDVKLANSVVQQYNAVYY